MQGPTDLFAWARQRFTAELDARLASRKAGRLQRSSRSRKSAKTKRHSAYARDALLREQVPF